MSSPDGIRTHATAVRGRRPRPLDDGAGTDPSSQHSSLPYAHLIACGGLILLGYQDFSKVNKLSRTRPFKLRLLQSVPRRDSRGLTKALLDLAIAAPGQSPA